MRKEEIFKNYENLDLEKLPAIIHNRGYEYHLLERAQTKCLYAQLDSKTQKTHAYEVFKTRITDNHDFVKHCCRKLGVEFIPENHRQHKEAFPGNEEFDKRAWTYPSLNLAKQKFDSLA